MKNIKYFLILIIILPIIVTANNNYNIPSCNTEIDIINDSYVYEEIVDFKFNNPDVLATKTLPSNTKNIIVDKDYFLETSDNKLLKIYSGSFEKRYYNIKYTIPDTNSINICSNYNSNVDNITFRINASNILSEENITFYLNDKEIDLDYTLDDKTIKGTYHKLNENDILSVKIDYDTIYYDTYTILCIIVPISFVLLSALLWYIFGKDLKYKVTKISRLPKSISLLNIALVNDGIVTKEEAYYLLLDLANRGYINIIENKNGTFTLERIRDYDGKDYIEASFLKALFRHTIRVTITEYVEAISEGKKEPVKELDKTINDENISNNFKRACNNILDLINANEEKNKYFELKSDNKKLYLIAMVAIILVLVTSLPWIEMKKLYLLPISVVFSVTVLYISLYFISIMDLKYKKTRVGIIIMLALCAAIVLLLPSFNHNKIYIIAFIISIVSVIIILFFYKYMPKRTIYGTKVYSKIEGFKLFLDDLREEELKVLLEHNPNYLYEILPVSYILDREDIVINNLKKYNLEEPKWYKMEKGYTPDKFHNSITRLKNKIIEENEEN